MDGEPLSWDNYYIPESVLGAGFRIEELGSSVYDYLEKRCGRYIWSTNARIQPAICDVSLSRALRVPEGTLLLKVLQTHYGKDARPVFYSVEWFLNSRYEIVIARSR